MRPDPHVEMKRKNLLGGRLGLFGLGLILVAFFLWMARDFIPSLAAKRSMATATVSIEHSTDAQLQRAFTDAKQTCPVEAGLALQTNPSLPGVYALTVTADTSERAKADLVKFNAALTSAFPAAERNLMVSPNNSTLPAPNEVSRRIAIAVLATIVLLMLGSQLLLVIGAHLEGMSRAGLIAALLMPFTILIYPTSGGRSAQNYVPNSPAMTDWKFVFLLLALTPISLIVSLWLSRTSRSRKAS